MASSPSLNPSSPPPPPPPPPQSTRDSTYREENDDGSPYQNQRQPQQHQNHSQQKQRPPLYPFLSEHQSPPNNYESNKASANASSPPRAAYHHNNSSSNQISKRQNNNNSKSSNNKAQQHHQQYPQYNVQTRPQHSREYSSLTAASFEDLLHKDDQAELGLLQSIEARRAGNDSAAGNTNAAYNSSSWQASVPGERPPLGDHMNDETHEPFMTAMMNHHHHNTAADTSVTSHHSHGTHPSRGRSRRSSGGGTHGRQGSSSSINSQGSASKLADIARRMRQNAAKAAAAAAQSGMPQDTSTTSSVSIPSNIISHHTTASYHRRAPSRAHALLDSITEMQEDYTDVVTGANTISGHHHTNSSGTQIVSNHAPTAVFDGVTVIGNTPSFITTHDGFDSKETPAAELSQAVNNTEKLITGANLVEELFDDHRSNNTTVHHVVESVLPSTQEETEEEVQEGFEVHEHDLDIVKTGDTGETLALTSHDYTSASYDGLKRADSLGHSHAGSHGHGSHQSKQHTGQHPLHTATAFTSSSSPYQDPTRSPKSRAQHIRRMTSVKKKQTLLRRLCWSCCHPLIFFQRLIDLLWYHSLIVHVAIPCFVTAYIFYYGFRNPQWTFLPGHASVAWWCNFFGRQVIVLELARIIQWFFIDKLVLGTRIAVKCLGPLLTLCFIQGRGWPFCIAVWGFFDLLLLEGSGQFEQHWLYFIPSVGLYSSASHGGDDSGSYILASESYVRVLLSMMLAGVATAIKRTTVAMYFGRRTFVEFKPRLERLLKEVVLVSEVAQLADEAEIVASEEAILEMTSRRDNHGDGGGRNNKVKVLGDVTWSNKSKRRKANGDGQSNRILVVTASEDNSDSDDEDGDEDDDDDNDADDDDDDSEITTQQDIKPESGRVGIARQSSRGSVRILNLLEHWDEPVNRADKSLNASISDILRFRRALTFMDDAYPFGESFGPANTREQLVSSSHAVYKRLLQLTPGKDKVSCEFYDMLALEDDGETVNNGKRKALRKLFRPDASNELSLLAFIQSCDSLYKKLRYFRANVGNASVIDHALESIVDGAFSFALVLVLLSVMRINPWPLLVSLSTLLVSVSFAVGSSASKWFEGMLLVAARRPYDLGDRIYMNDPSLIISDGLWYCWFVEDINLFHTTVRYAGTNEVATINNGSVANMRIINGQRSPNAMVWWQTPYRVNLLQDGNIDKIKQALTEYAQNNPRNWHSFSYFRVDEVHGDIEKLVVTIGMQHRSSWQDLVTILEAKAACMCWLLEYGRKLGVNYDELPKRDLLYYAGSLKDGRVPQDRYQLHDPSNIVQGPIPAVAIDDGRINRVVSGSDTDMMNKMSSTKSLDDSTIQKKVDDVSENAKFLEQLKHSQQR